MTKIQQLGLCTSVLFNFKIYTMIPLNVCNNQNGIKFWRLTYKKESITNMLVLLRQRWTPLRFAMECDNTDAVSTLLLQGANRDVSKLCETQDFHWRCNTVGRLIYVLYCIDDVCYKSVKSKICLYVFT